MTPGRTDPDVVDRHLAALRRTLAALRRHAGVSPRSLRADSDRRPPGEAAPVLAIGVDGCPAGWFFVALEPSGASRCGIVRTLDELVRNTREPALVLVDIPIGLPDGPGGRECDREARRVLGPRRSSVFSAPARAVLDAIDYEDAKRRSRTAAGVGLSKQAFAIVPKCREVNELLRADARARRIVRETHPEVCFWALAGRKPMKHGKKTEEGWKERIAVLNRLRPASGQEIEGMLGRFRRREVARDDAVDALAAAVTASADAAALRTLPSEPPTDSVGLPMEMVWFEPETTGSIAR